MMRDIWRGSACGRFGSGRLPDVVMIRVEPADQLVELERGLPNVAEQAAARASAAYAATAIDGGVVPLVLGATALELPGSDFQTRSHRGDCRRIEDSLYPAAGAVGRE
jgi:hypothetical protein